MISLALILLIPFNIFGASNTVSGFMIQELYKPQNGKSPSTEEIIISNSHVELKSATWLVKENDNYIELKEEFYNKEDYAILLEVVCKEDYKFSDDFKITFNGSTIEKVDDETTDKTCWYIKDNTIYVFILDTSMPGKYDSIYIGAAVLAVGLFTLLGNKFGNKLFNKGKVIKK